MATTITNLRITSTVGGINTTAFTSDASGSGTVQAGADFSTDGTATLYGTGSPGSPLWYNGTPPSVWMSYEITSTGGTSTVFGGLTAATRYQMNTPRTLGIEKAALGVANKTFTISYYDAASGGNLLGTKTLACSVEVV